MAKVGIKTLSNDDRAIAVNAYTDNPNIIYISVNETGGSGVNFGLSAELPLTELKRMIESLEETLKEAE